MHLKSNKYMYFIHTLNQPSLIYMNKNIRNPKVKSIFPCDTKELKFTMVYKVGFVINITMFLDKFITFIPKVNCWLIYFFRFTICGSFKCERYFGLQEKLFFTGVPWFDITHTVILLLFVFSDISGSDGFHTFSTCICAFVNIKYSTRISIRLFDFSFRAVLYYTTSKFVKTFKISLLIRREYLNADDARKNAIF